MQQASSCQEGLADCNCVYELLIKRYYELVVINTRVFLPYLAAVVHGHSLTQWLPHGRLLHVHVVL